MAFPRLDLPPFRVTASGLLLPGNQVGGNIPSEQDHFTRTLMRWGEEVEVWGQGIDTAGHVLAARSGATQAMNVAANTNLIYPTIVQQSGSAVSYNTLFGIMTANITGWYQISFNAGMSAGGAGRICQGWIDATGAGRLGESYAASDVTYFAGSPSGTTTIFLTATQTARVVGFQQFTGTFDRGWFSMYFLRKG
jgi:hypothetical protein